MSEKYEHPLVLISSDILGYLEKNAWPMRLDLFIQQRIQFDHSEMLIQHLLKEIESNASIREEWLSLPAPPKKDNDGAWSGVMSALDRIRVYGTQRTRAYLLGAKLRHLTSRPTEAKKENWMITPIPCWKFITDIFKEDEIHQDLQLEIALLLTYFFNWLDESAYKANAVKQRIWLEKQKESWTKLWIRLGAEAKGGQSLPRSMILKTQILFDLGRATLFAITPEAQQHWAKAEKNGEVRALTLKRESAEFGYCSAQLSALWAQAIGTVSGLATPLRLMMRPWRTRHKQVKDSHARIIQYLESSEEKKAA
jgi:hypothetical protein